MYRVCTVFGDLHAAMGAQRQVWEGSVIKCSKVLQSVTKRYRKQRPVSLVSETGLTAFL